MGRQWGILTTVFAVAMSVAEPLYAAAPAWEFPYSKQTNLAPGAYKFVFSLYDSTAVGAPAKWTSGTVALTMKTPLLVYSLGSGLRKIPATVNFSQQLYVKVVKTSPAPTTVIANRERLAIAPYALWSASGGSGGTITGVNAGAGLLGGGTGGDVSLSVDNAVVQQRVVGECPAGNAVRVIGPDGSVTCEAVGGGTGSGDITGVTAGTGLTGGGDQGAVVIGANIGSGAGQVAAGDHAHGTVYISRSEVDALLATRDSIIATLQAQVAALQSLLQHFSRVGNEITISGANLSIVSGSGSTSGTPNSLGNLVIGYNAKRGGTSDVRTGSHNLIVGDRQNYSSYGGIVAGYSNLISGSYASVSGGSSNTASGAYSSVSGGSSNTASGNYASVGGGNANKASGASASVAGGRANNAVANYSAVLGGDTNIAGDPTVTPTPDRTIGEYSTVSGGKSNNASGDWSSVSAGWNNFASGSHSSVVGGGAPDPYFGNKAVANYSTILGGTDNIAGSREALPSPTVGEFSTISGGSGNTASGENSSVGGGNANRASGLYSAVGGGISNTASGGASSVSGGDSNTASGTKSSVSGGMSNFAIANWSSVSGGNSNTAGERSVIPGVPPDPTKGEYSSVSGGGANTASGTLSSVSGGSNVAESDVDGWSGGAYHTP